LPIVFRITIENKINKYPMKAKFNFLLVLIACIITVLSCKKKTEDPPPASDVSGYWEYRMQAPQGEVRDRYYQITLQQNGNQLTGDLVVMDSANMLEGLILGSVTGSQVDFTADLPGEKYDFRFSGTFINTVSLHKLEGRLTLLSPNFSGMEPFGAIMLRTDNYKCPEVFVDNPYVFRKVKDTLNPTGPPVIFVHGMTGSLKNWDSIISHLSNNFLSKHKVYVYQYNWKDSVRINGRILKDSVEAAGLSDPIIIAHSMGGLVSRAYIASGGQISKLVTLGTPHLGTPLVEMIGIFCFVNFPGPQNMLPEGEYIQSMLVNPVDINNRTKYYAIEGHMTGSYVYISPGNSPWIWGEPFYNLVDKVGYHAFTLVGNPDNDGLVNVTSGFFEGGNVNKPLSLQQVDHFNLINPAYAPEIMSYINSL
jgi:pimeloyl-ACP methyl ester carboxylesterase